MTKRTPRTITTTITEEREPEPQQVAPAPVALDDGVVLLGFEETPQDKEQQPDPLAALRARLNLPAHAALKSTLRVLPLDALIVAREQNAAKGAQSFADNLGFIGMQHPPAVYPDPAQTDLGETRYLVIAGRRRVMAARAQGDVYYLECRVYSQALTPAQVALIRLSENLRRSAAWVEEVRELANLVSSGVAMTEQEVAKALGVTVQQVRERIKIARLPQAFLDEVYADRLSESAARQITRLSPTRQQMLLDALDAGEKLTAEVVHHALTAQLGTVAPSLDAALSAATSTPVEPAPEAEAAAVETPTSTSTTSPRQYVCALHTSLRAVVQLWTTQPGIYPARARTLAQALLVELEALPADVIGGDVGAERN